MGKRITYTNQITGKEETALLIFATTAAITAVTITINPDDLHDRKTLGGATFLNPRDTYDPDEGRKQAVRKACHIGQYIRGFLTHRLNAEYIRRDIYSAYRKSLRQVEQKE